MVSRYIDLTGKVFGRLTVVALGPGGLNSEGGKIVNWWCQCSCGREDLILCLPASLKSGHTKSCGCYKNEKTSERALRHGLHKHPLFKVWSAIQQRCTNPKTVNYKNYGGRGIDLCKEWRLDFKTFYDWSMANGWEKGLQIDRINNDGNYEPGNCRWVTASQNMRNTSRSTKFMVYGQELNFIDIYKNYAPSWLSFSTFRARVKDRGVGIYEALYSRPASPIDNLPQNRKSN